MKYATVDDATKVVVNMSVWDGVTPYTPPVGTTMVNVDGILCGIGWIQQPDGSFLPPEDNG
jgi:hypothetical protein